MASNSISKVIREYTSDDSFTKFDIPRSASASVKEFQVALTFARDYDGKNSTKGKFIPYWDTVKVTPEVIAHFKTKYPSAKVLVSIGNDKGQFPFQIDEPHLAAWVSNATESLTGIIKDYKLDGIDVYYEDIVASSPAIFVYCIGELIKNLKEHKVITEASISPNAATHDNYYKPLYLDYQDYIDTVVFQLFTAGSVEKVLNIADQYPPNKLLLGYSGIPEDWAIVSPPVFFVVLFVLLIWGKINGASLKVTTCSIAYFPPKWILDLLSFFSNPGSFKLQAP
ncbi:RuBisCO-associated protein [Spatholobus suberectus]|nr:RuBisCO-associated protein [Spatholobus suberectus]